MITASKEWHKKYPLITRRDSYNGRLEWFDNQGKTLFYFFRDSTNCAAVQLQNIRSECDIEHKALEDLCSINGINIIHGSCSLNDFNKYLAPSGYRIIYEYISNRDSDFEGEDDEESRFWMITDPKHMVMFVKEIKNPLAKGYTFYSGEIPE